MYDLKEIKVIRKKLGITQGELAKLSNVSQSMIAKIESNILDPSYTNACKIFNALNDLNNKNFVLVLFDISDPGNLGTIVRSADAFGVDLIVLVGNPVDITNGKIIRSSAGSIFNVALKQSDLSELLDALKSFKGNIYQTRLNQEMTLNQVDLRKPLVWIFGNEAHGLSEFPMDLGINLSIPMTGKTESLNVSTAASLCMYETAKSRFIK